MLLPSLDRKPVTLLENRWSLGIEYQIIREIGRGSYSKVFEAIETKTSQRVAIKKFINALAHAQLAQYCLREIEILSKMHHPNIVKISRALRSGQSVYLVMEYMPLDLRKAIHSPRYLTIDQIKSIMYEITIAINYLHSAKIVHRDIKPGNILITQEGKVKLCDLGLARSICGLKITAYDFDEIYRREFAESADGVVENSEQKEKELEDLDEHANIHTELSMPGHFAVDMDKLKAQHPQSPISKKFLKRKDSGVVRVASCGVVPELPPQLDEETKTKARTNKSGRVTARRTQLIKSMKQDPHMERELTSHIASRWYRSPEVILLEKVYCSAVDMWALGCVFAELLQMRPGNRAGQNDRKALFPGTSCFPLSPQMAPNSPEDLPQFSSGDQLLMICKILGTPTEDDMAFISDQGAKQYASMLPKCQPAKLKELFPDSTDEELDLLKQLLTFNPFMRATAMQALQHPYFASLRRKDRETACSPLSFENDFPTPASIQKLSALCLKV